MSSVLKHSYTVPCSSVFRDAVEALAARRNVNVGDLARSVLLVVPAEAVDAFPDPGGPPSGEREVVVLKSGPAAGRPWRRKPRLQVRMPPGYSVPFVRRSLALALALDRGELKVNLDAVAATPAPAPVNDNLLVAAREELERLRAIVNVLAFEPLSDGVRNRDEALHVLGFPPGSWPGPKLIRAKFRMLATIHHPDSPHGNHQRMAQMNAAMEILKRTG